MIALRFAKPAIILLVITLAFRSCLSGGEDATHLSDLQQIAAETPVYPDFAEVQPPRHSGKRENAGLTYFYRSLARYEDVKAYYMRLLLPKGWSNPSEQEVPKWFVKDGSKALTFRKGDY